MDTELKYIGLLSQDAINFRLNELELEIGELEMEIDVNHFDRRKKTVSWESLTNSLSASKLSKIEACWTLAKLYKQLDEPVSYRRSHYKCKRLINRLLIEDQLMDTPSYILDFNCPELSKLFASIAKKRDQK